LKQTQTKTFKFTSTTLENCLKYSNRELLPLAMLPSTHTWKHRMYYVSI